MDIAEWLREVGLPQYEAAFRDNDVDGSILPRLTAHDLNEIGVTSVGHRRKLLDAIAELEQGGAALAVRASVGLDETETETATHEPERRQLTVMFCDLAGSTALSARLDPEDTRLVIRAYQDAVSGIVSRYDGYVAKFMGDGVLAYFGYPSAHEDDAERAVRAGLGIAEAVGKLDTPAKERLAVRIGVATGLVVVGDRIGKGLAQEQAVVGDTPNHAARLQNLAEPGNVVIAGSTRRLLGSQFQLRDLGRQQVKGVAQPIETWVVEAVRQTESRFDAASAQSILPPIIGRDQEINLLLERWRLAQDGDGQLVLLSGEPGIGKSRLISALRERLEPLGAQSLLFQCSPYYVNSAFWPSISNFERALKFSRDELPESKLDKLETLIVGQLGQRISDVRFIASMLSIPNEHRYGPTSLIPQKFKDETLRVQVDLLEAIARKQPSVMLFEDAHWADPSSLEMLDLLIDRAKSFPLLIVITHRPEFQSRWSQHGHVINLNLSKLTRSQSAAMVVGVAGSEALPPDIVEQILSKTDGVPLFVEELTRSVVESSRLSHVRDQQEQSRLDSFRIAIPATLRDSLMARLDRFVPVKEIAQIGAAIGREFSYELISAVTPMPQAELDASLGRLIDSGLAFRRGRPPEATYTFKHALVQDAAYDSLLKNRRQELHYRIARVIHERFPAVAESNPEVLARHYALANDRSAAIPLWKKAGEHALARMALQESIAHLNKGLELVKDLPESAERDAHELSLRLPLGIAWLALQGWATPEVRNSLNPAVPLAKSLNKSEVLLTILTYLQTNLVTQGRIGESFGRLQEIVETVNAAGDPDVAIYQHFSAYVYLYAGRLKEAVEESERTLELYDDQKHRHLADVFNHDVKTLAGVYLSIAAWLLGYPDRSVALAVGNEVHSRSRGHPFDLGFALYTHSFVFHFRQDHSEVMKRAEECGQIGYDNSLPVLTMMLAPIARGLALIGQGKIADGLPLLRSGTNSWELTGGTITATYTNAVVAAELARSGNFKDALELVDKQIAKIEQPGWGERIYYAEILRIKGSILVQIGDIDGAERAYRASLDWAREQEAKSWELRTSTSLARLLQSRGKNPEAHELLAPVYNWFTEGFDTQDLKEAKALLEVLQTRH